MRSRRLNPSTRSSLGQTIAFLAAVNLGVASSAFALYMTWPSDFGNAAGGGKNAAFDRLAAIVGQGRM